MASLVCRIAASYALVFLFDNMVIAWAEGFSWVVLLGLYVGRLIVKGRNTKDSPVSEL